MSDLKKIIRRGRRVRLHIREVGSRPRLSVFRSNAHIWASIIDDATSKTVATCGDVKLKGTKTERAQQVGTEIAKLSLAAGVKQVAFDRGSYRYHGRVKALADAARTGGLDF